jgi:chitodextrinase
MNALMWGAAPRSRRLTVAVVAVISAAALFAASADARVNAGSSTAQPTTVWGIEVTGQTLALLDARTAQRARAAGLNTLLLSSPLNARQRARAAKVARRHHFAVVRLSGARTTSARPGCRPWGPCIVATNEIASAASLVDSTDVDAVVVRVKKPTAVRSLSALGTYGPKVIALVSLRGKPKKSRWAPLITQARNLSGFDLAVAPSGPSRRGALNQYLGFLSASDVSAPGTPRRLALVAVASNSLTLRWDPSRDNRGVAGYSIYRGDTRMLDVTTTQTTLGSLACGTSYTLAVDAYDAAGNRSRKTTIQASTTPCVASGGLSPPRLDDTSPPSAPQGLSTSGATATSISVSWLASNDDTGIAGYGIYLGGVAAGETPSNAYTLNGLTCGTTYSISVDAYDAAGNRSSRTTTTGSTIACPAPDTTVPSVPTGLTKTGSTTTTVSLTWNASTDNVGVAGYKVYRNGVVVGTTAGTTYTVSGLACGTSYLFAVGAYDAAGNQATSGSKVAATDACPAPDTTAPSAPTGLASSSQTTTSVALSWNASTDNVAVVGYGVYNGATLLATTTSQSFTVSGLTCGTGYTLSVDAFDAGGNRSARSQTNASTAACPVVDSSAPSAPSGLVGSGATTSSLTLSWGASSDNVGVTGYQTFRNGTAVATTSSLSSVFSGLACGTTYTLGVEAFDAAGNRSPRSSISASTSACPDIVAPSAPSGLVVSGVTATSITLGWTASTDNIGVTGYTTYRGSTAQGDSTVTTYTFTGLTCGTSYLLAVEAYDSGGNRSTRSSTSASTSACADTSAPTAPSGLTGGAASTTSITLSWTASTDNVGVAGYTAYRGTTSQGNTTSTSYTFTGLACGTSYTLAVDAYDASGNRSSRPTLTAATAACTVADTTPPSVPQNQQIGSATQTGFTMTWSVSTDNVGVAGYRAYLNGAVAGTTSGLSYTYTGLTCGTTYTVALEAFDAAGNVSDKAFATGLATTAACPGDTQAPTTPASLAATGSTATSISLSWSASLDNVGVAAYTVYNGGSSAGTTALPSYTLNGLACGTSYTLSVDAYDAAGNRSARAQINASTSACADVIAPSTPTSLTRTAGTATSITVSWTASTDNVGVTGYTAYRNGTAVGTSTSPSYTFSGLACGTTYTLGVEAFDAAGNRSSRTTLDATTAACADATAPSAPTALTRTAATTTSVTLAWTASTDNVGVTGYSLFRDGGAVTTTTNTSYAFTGLMCGTTYTLGVEAYDAANNRSTRSSLTTSTNACPDTAPPSAPTGLTRSGATTSSITLTWTASTDNVGVAGYTAYLGTANQADTTATSRTFTGLACGTSYTLGVEAYDAAGNRSSRPTLTASTAACAVADTTPPSVPQGQTIVAMTQTSITMTWLASTDNVGVAGYRAFLNGSAVGTTTSLTYTYSGLQCGTTYTVALEAFDAAGNASNRLEAQGSVTTGICSDTSAPSAPTGLLRSAATANSITLTWSASTDNVGVTGYTAFRDSATAGTTISTSYTYTGLVCGATYVLGVEAYDAAGNRSSRSTLTAATSSCTTDTQAPTVPTGLAASAPTGTSITVSWNASADNVGVVGYGRYMNGSLSSTASGTTFSFTGLTCGTNYALGVDAVDAAGNRSARAQINAATAACSSTPPPSGPTANLWVDTNGGTCARQSAAGSYADAQACTWSTAYLAAQTGDTVRVRNGSYGDVTITANNTALASPGVQFIGESATGVVLTDLLEPRDWMNIRDITIDTTGLHGRGMHGHARNATYDNVDVRGPWANWASGYASPIIPTNITWKNSEMGTPGNTQKRICGAGDGEPVQLAEVNGITFDNVTFHPFIPDGGNSACGPDNTMHLETIRMDGNVDNFTIKNSTFTRGRGDNTAIVFVTGAGSNNLKLIGNFFGRLDGPGAGTTLLHLTDRSDCTTMQFAYNKFEGGWVNSCSSQTGMLWVGNTGPYPGCGGTHIRNLWAASGAPTCGSDTFVSDCLYCFGALAYASDGIHLLSSSPAINGGESTYCQALTGSVDIDGRARSGTCDAGPDEYGN